MSVRQTHQDTTKLYTKDLSYYIPHTKEVTDLKEVHKRQKCEECARNA